MSNANEATKLNEFGRALPDRIKAANLEVSSAEKSLAHLLTYRAVGRPVKAAEIDAARKTLALARQELEDLRAIENVLPGLTYDARILVQQENSLYRAKAQGEARQAFNVALADLQQRNFGLMTHHEVRALGERVRGLAVGAGRLQEFKDAISDQGTGISNTRGGDVLLELI